MKISIRTLLLITAVVGIQAAGIASLSSLFTASAAGFAILTIAYAPVWMPAIFIAYAIGKKSLSIKLVLLLAVTEAIFVAAALRMLGE